MSVPDETVNAVTWRIPNALVLIGSRSGDDWNAMTASWVTQVAQAPVLIGVGIDTEAVTHRLIEEGGSFSVNLWDAENTRPFVKFSKPATKDGMTLNGWAIEEAPSGAPFFSDAVAWMDCEVHRAVPCGSHTFFIGELTAAALVDPQARPASMSDTRMKYGGTRRGHS